MMHLTGTLVCRFCSHRFAVCIPTDSRPDPTTQYTVRCPMNASKLRVTAKDLVPAETCPPHAVGQFELDEP